MKKFLMICAALAGLSACDNKGLGPHHGTAHVAKVEMNKGDCVLYFKDVSIAGTNRDTVFRTWVAPYRNTSPSPGDTIFRHSREEYMRVCQGLRTGDTIRVVQTYNQMPRVEWNRI